MTGLVVSVGIAVAMSVAAVVLALLRFAVLADDHTADPTPADDLMAVADAVQAPPSLWSERDVSFLRGVGVKP